MSVRGKKAGAARGLVLPQLGRSHTTLEGGVPALGKCALCIPPLNAATTHMSQLNGGLFHFLPATLPSVTLALGC